MAVRQTEFSYTALMLRTYPDYYARSRNSAAAEYKFSNGRQFLGHDLYDNYAPFTYFVEYEGEIVFYGGEAVTYETTEILS